MPLVAGGAVSYSPLLYRPRDAWGAEHAELAGTVPQPAAFHRETPAILDGYAARISDAFAELASCLQHAALDAVVTLTSDRGTLFDATNVPQLHVFCGDDMSGIAGTRSCLRDLGETIAEELASAGFDISESRGNLTPNAHRSGAGAALFDAVARLVPAHVPIVPIHINCHVAPVITGRRALAFGRALAGALELVPERVGVVISGGLSGDPGGPLAGWIDDVLDRWILRRIETRRSSDIARIFDVESMTLDGAAREIRLWLAAGGMMESVEARARQIDYIPLHHAATGVAFMTWER